MEGVAREPSGRVSRAKEAADAVAVNTRARHLGITRAQARDERTGSFIGYLFLIGDANGLSKRQFLAAESYLKLRSSYLRAIGAPDASRDTGTPGMPSEVISDEYQSWCAATIEAYDNCRKDIQEAQNYSRENLWAAIDIVLVRGERVHEMIGTTRTVCNVLAKHFRLLDRPAQITHFRT